MLKKAVSREDNGISVITQLFQIQAHIREWRNDFAWHLLTYFLEWLQSKYWQLIRTRILYCDIYQCSPGLSFVIQPQARKHRAKICTVNVSYWWFQASWMKISHDYIVSVCSCTLILHSISSMVQKSPSISSKSDQSKRIICMNRSTLYNINNVISVRKMKLKM